MKSSTPGSEKLFFLIITIFIFLCSLPLLLYAILDCLRNIYSHLRIVHNVFQPKSSVDLGTDESQKKLNLANGFMFQQLVCYIP